MVSMAGTRRTYAPWLGRLWVAAAVAGAAYGIFLLATALAVPIWWVYAISQILITAGFYFGRTPKASDPAATPAE
jgi:uncharacterized membrane protein YhhN